MAGNSYPGLVSIIDPAAEVELRRLIAAEAYEAGLQAGHARGVHAMAEAYKRGLKGTVRHANVHAARYTVHCRDCRSGVPRDGCERCEIRDPDTYGKPHPDDFPGAAL